MERVLGAENAFALEALSIDEGAVGAAEIAEADLVFVDDEEAMLPTDPFAVGANMALRPAPEQILAPVESERASARVAVQDDELNLHRPPSRLRHPILTSQL